MAAPCYVVAVASTLISLLIHVTFSTKHREPIIPEAVEADLFAYIGGVCRRCATWAALPTMFTC